MSNSLQEVLAELQKNYLASLPDKCTNLESLWKQGELKLLKTEYHKLKGTGRTYGLPEVSQLGQALERICELGAGPDLDAAVPVSLNLLLKIRDSRQGGKAFDLEAQESFQKIVDLLSKASKT